MGAWFPLVPGSLTDGLSVLIGNLSIKTRSYPVSLWKASHWQSSLSDSTSIYVGVSGSMGQDPDTPTYMEVISDRDDCQCEAFQRATG